MYLVITYLRPVAQYICPSRFRIFIVRFVEKTGVNIPFGVFENKKGRFFLETAKVPKKTPRKAIFKKRVLAYYYFFRLSSVERNNF
jgi:hypothetical protein